MKSKGFLLVEVLIGLAFIGLISMSYLPILNVSLNNFTRIKDRSEMSYIGEMVVEKFKTQDEIIRDYINQLDIIDSIEYIDDSFDTDKYSCMVIKTKESPRLLELIVRVTKTKQENSSYVEYKTSIPIY